MSDILPLFDTMQEHRDNKAYSHPEHHQHYPYQHDLTIAENFIYSYRGSLATFNAYRREVERLLQWCTHISKKSLKELRRTDLEAYIEFCQSPPDEWIALRKYDRYIEKNGQRIPNPDWRPFVINSTPNLTSEKREYQLSQKALQSIFAILGSFFNYLIQEDYIGSNPVAQIRQKSKFIRAQQHAAPVRRLSELQWAYVIETAELMASESHWHERTLFIMNALYGMYLRISELAESERWRPSMRDFYCDHDGHWWFRTVGKGNKERNIVVSDAMLNALKRYRRSLGLAELPNINDQRPLLLRHKGKGAIQSTRQIRSIVEMCFQRAIERMRQDGFAEESRQLEAATVHWLRHTGISDDVKRRPREHVRDDAGHSSSAITDRYIDIELRERHASGRSKTIKPT
jgi:site-specific recombinase XerD